MNRANIQATIEVLKQAQNFRITTFQSGRYKVAKTVEELHKCGNTACIAGYVALSQAWRDFGGYAYEGVPSRKGDKYENDAASSMAAFWELPEDDVEAIIFGTEWNDFLDKYNIVGLPPFDFDEEGDEDCDTGWYTLTKDDAVSLFEQLLAKG